jgi:RNA polymerase sigma factor (sigma-70 family)
VPLNLDPSLIESAAGDSAALERLIAAVWPEAYRLAAGILHDPGLAEDAAQEACAAMAVSLSSLKNVLAFRTWFYRLVVREAISVSRRRRNQLSLHEAASKAIEDDRAQTLDLATPCGACRPNSVRSCFYTIMQA